MLPTFLDLLAQTAVDPTSIPPPEGSGSWWPFVILSFVAVSSAIGGVWSAWLSLKNKKVDHEHMETERKLSEQREQQQQRFLAEQQAKEKRWEFEHEKMKEEFKRSAQFQDDLMTELREEKKYTRELIEAHRTMAGLVMERDAIIKSQNETIVELERKVAALESRIEELTRHVRSLESASVAHREVRPERWDNSGDSQEGR